MKVTVVVDGAFDPSGHAPLGPAFWLIESPDNRVLAERLFKSEVCDPNSAVFNGRGYASANDAAIAIFPTVVEHHPTWTEVEFIGGTLDADVHRAFADEGIELLPTVSGFIALAPHSSGVR